jgi:hypothetical protein
MLFSINSFRRQTKLPKANEVTEGNDLHSRQNNILNLFDEYLSALRAGYQLDTNSIIYELCFPFESAQALAVLESMGYILVVLPDLITHFVFFPLL